MSWYRVDVSCEAFRDEELELDNTSSYLIEANAENDAKLKAIKLSEDFCNSKDSNGVFVWVTKGVMDVYHIGKKLESGTKLGQECIVKHPSACRDVGLGLSFG